MAASDPGRYGGLAAVGRQLAGGSAIDLFIPAADSGLLHSWCGPSGWDRGDSGDVRVRRLAASGDDLLFPHQPSAVSWAPDRLDVFAVTAHGDLWHFTAAGQDEPDVSWSGQCLGHPAAGPLVSGAAAVALGNGQMMVFARCGEAGALMACSRGPGGEHWSWRDLTDELGWAKPLRGSVFGPAACSWGPGRIDLFCVSGTVHAGTLEHTWQQDFPGKPGWHPDYWEQPKAFILTSSPVAVAWPGPEEISVVYRNVAGIDGSSVGLSHWVSRNPVEAFSQTAGHFYLDWENEIIYQQTSPDDAMLSFPVLASSQKRRLDVFWVRSDLQLQHGRANAVGSVKEWIWEWESMRVAWPQADGK
jgi:hypothetical protein